MTCCGKYICIGCIYKSVKNDKKNGLPEHEVKCAFCRQPPPKNNIKALKKLMKKNNPIAFLHMAKSYEEGEEIFQSDTKALEMCIRAAELGSAQAFGLIGNNYKDGIAVETNASKAIEFYDLAAKKGSITGHQVLAEIHKFSGNNHKHIKHLTVAASAGYQVSRRPQR